MMSMPTRFTVNSFMRWIGLTDTAATPVLDLMYLGASTFACNRKRCVAVALPQSSLSDDELRSLPMPVLLHFGDLEVIYNPAQAFDRARRLIADFKAG